MSGYPQQQQPQQQPYPPQGMSPSPPQQQQQQQQQQYFPPQQPQQQQWNQQPQGQSTFPPQQAPYAAGPPQQPYDPNQQVQPAPYQQPYPPHQQQQQQPQYHHHQSYLSSQPQQPPQQHGFQSPPPPQQHQHQSPPPQQHHQQPPPGAHQQAPPGQQQQQQRSLGGPPPGNRNGGFGLFSQFMAPVPETLVLKEKFSFSGDDFDIQLLSGNPVFKVKGSVMSWSGRKSVVDLRSGRHLFDIQKEHLHIHATFALNSPEGRKLGEVKSGFAFFGSKATCTITPDNGPPLVLKMKGGWLDLDAQITNEANGQVAAVINRKLGGKDLFFGRQTYHVSVTPGYDLSVIAAMCICLDEKNNEGSGAVF